MAALNGRLYFAATTAAQGNELWSTDGTTAGTSVVSDIYPGADGSNPNDLMVGQRRRRYNN